MSKNRKKIQEAVKDLVAHINGLDDLYILIPTLQGFLADRFQYIRKNREVSQVENLIFDTVNYGLGAISNTVILAKLKLEVAKPKVEKKRNLDLP